MKNINLGDFIFESLSRFMALSVFVVLVAIFVVLYIDAKPAIDSFGTGFLTGEI